MEINKVFETSLIMIAELQSEIDSSDFIDCGLRMELVYQCICISIEHSIGVNALLVAELPIQAMILFRSQFEAVVRSYWLLFLAKNEDILKLNFNWTFDEQFQKDKYPMVSEMIDGLLNANLPAHQIIQHLSDFKKYHLKQLNSFVHTGKHSFTRNIIGFDKNMMAVLMCQSNNLIIVASQILFKHSIPDNQKFIDELIIKYRNCFYMEEDVDPLVKAKVDSYF